MSKALATVLKRGLPFPVSAYGSFWDGVTFEEIGAITLELLPEKPPLDFPVSAPAPNKVGPGTIYPIGMHRDNLAKIAYRVRRWRFQSTFIEDEAEFTEDETFEAGVPTIGSTDAVGNEIQLITTYGLRCGSTAISPKDTPPEPPPSLFAGGGCFIGIMLSGGLVDPTYAYDRSVSTQLFPIGDKLRNGGTIAFKNDIWRRVRAVRIGDVFTGNVFYPAIIHGGIFEGGEVGRQAYLCHGEKLKGGEEIFGGELAQVRGGNATLTFNPVECTFYGSGTAERFSADEPEATCSYEFTLSPTEEDGYWGYDGTYDTTTGLPL